ncbi:MAG: sulfur carrier protein ThiS [bacterium]
MEIKLEYVSMLNLDVENGATIEVEDNIQVQDLLEELGLEKKQQRFIKPFINEEEKRPTSTLSDGDKLFLFLPAGGG